MTILLNKLEITKWVDKIIFTIIPIILAIINIMLIRKNKLRKIQIISYIATIIIATLDILGIIGNYWNIIAIIMQLIHIYGQEAIWKEYVECSEVITRKNLKKKYMLML